MRFGGSFARKLGAALAVAVLALSLGAPVVARAEDAASLPVSVDGEQLYNPTPAPETNTPAGILVDRDNGQVLFAKDADARRYPASTTKIMTALLVLEHGNLDDVVTVQADDFSALDADSMRSGLQADEQITVRDLLACLLLPSGNDAAYVLARYVGGTWQDFVGMMNAKAAELGCEDTHFANPCGLHNDDHYTTARDLCRIFEEALQNPTFVQIAGSATCELPATNKNPARELESTDFLVDPSSDAYAGGIVTAGKTGYTLEGGKCLVVAAQKDGRHLAAVTLGGANDAGYEEPTSNFYGMRDLLNWGFDAWQDATVVSGGEELGRVPVALSEDGTQVGAVAAGEVSAFVPAGLTLADLTIETQLPDELTAPVQQGASLGEASISYQGRCLGSVPVQTEASLSWSLKLFVQDWLAVPEHLLLVAAVIVAVILVMCAIVNLVRRAKRRREAADASQGSGMAFDQASGPITGSGTGSNARSKARPSSGKHFKS